MKNENIDHKILAKHFNKTNEAMRQLKRKYEMSKDGLWVVYISAYNWDTITPHEDLIKEKNLVSSPDGVSSEAYIMWLSYKGSKYTKQGKTLSANKLKKFDEATQIEMVETAIMNGWKGLFELKQQPKATPTRMSAIERALGRTINSAELEYIDVEAN